MVDSIPDNFSEFIKFRNEQKYLYTAGPASLVEENLLGMRPCFGRGDKDYSEIENSVLNQLKNLSDHKEIVRLQGSASLALEIMALNFLYGNVLIISTGFYSDRLIHLSNNAKLISNNIKKITVVDYKGLDSISGEFDWIFSCYTETSKGYKISIKKLKHKAEKLKSRIMLDATASIGLEVNHNFADVIGYSSCKGLFGLTGAAFIAFNDPPQNEVNSFYMNFKNHIDRKMTGPYHAICSLFETLKSHEKYKYSVIKNKEKFLNKFENFITVPNENQPLICTYTTCGIISKSDKAVLYKPRNLNNGSIVCHLGEIHLRDSARGNLVDFLDVEIL